LSIPTFPGIVDSEWFNPDPTFQIIPDPARTQPETRPNKEKDFLYRTPSLLRDSTYRCNLHRPTTLTDHVWSSHQFKTYTSAKIRVHKTTSTFYFDLCKKCVYSRNNKQKTYGKFFGKLNFLPGNTTRRRRTGFKRRLTRKTILTPSPEYGR
jgi:hypothetical protein